MIAFLRELRSQHHALFVAGILITIANFGLWSNRISTRLVYADSAKVVSLFADGQQRVITTDANTVGDLLTRAGVVLNSGDVVEPAPSTTLPAGYFNVNVYRAHPVVVVDGDKQYRLNTAYDSPRRAAEQAGLTLYPEDDFKVSTVTNFVDSGVVGDRIDVIRATPLTLEADGKTQVFRTQSKTVGQFLASINEPLGQKDVVAPAPSTPLSPGLEITITRVADVQTTVTEVIPHGTQKEFDPSLFIGQQQVKQAGSDGSKTVTYHIRYNNGVEVERDVLSVANAVPPQPEIIVVGTKSDQILGQQLAASRGWVNDEWISLYYLWNKESHWNPADVNPSSGACGIPQAYPCNKLGGSSDPAAQIEWGLNYIANRYGDPNKAWAFWQANGSY